MAYSVIAHGVQALGVNGGTSAGVNTTGADLLVVALGFYPVGVPNPTLSDSKGNTWTALTARNTTSTKIRLYYRRGATVGTGHTFTLTGAATYSWIGWLAVSGAHASPFDQEGGSAGTATTSRQPGALTPAAANALVVAAWDTDPGTGHGINGGFTAQTVNYSSGVNDGGGLAYLIQTSAAAANPTASWTGSAESSMAMATFLAAAGGGSAVPKILQQIMR